jgi:hypothetical protein
MSVTVTNLSFEDMPLGNVVIGTVSSAKRKRRFHLSGTAGAITDAFSIIAYEPNVDTIDYVAGYTVSNGTISFPGNGSYTVGSVAVGTTMPFTITGIISLK